MNFDFGTILFRLLLAALFGSGSARSIACCSASSRPGRTSGTSSAGRPCSCPACCFLFEWCRIWSRPCSGYNPLAHAIALMRSGFYPAYVPPGSVDPPCGRAVARPVPSGRDLPAAPAFELPDRAVSPAMRDRPRSPDPLVSVIMPVWNAAPAEDGRLGAGPDPAGLGARPDRRRLERCEPGIAAGLAAADPRIRLLARGANGGRRRRAMTGSARRRAASSPSSMPTTAGAPRSSPASSPSWARAAMRSPSRPIGGWRQDAPRRGGAGAGQRHPCRAAARQRDRLPDRDL